jgi:hypothetical protein
MGGQGEDTGGPSGVSGDATSILTDGTNRGGGDLTNRYRPRPERQWGPECFRSIQLCQWGNGGEATSQASGASSDGKNVTVEAIASGGGSSGVGIVSTY